MAGRLLGWLICTLFVWISRINSHPVVFFLTTNQWTVLSATINQRNEQSLICSSAIYASCHSPLNIRQAGNRSILLSATDRIEMGLWQRHFWRLSIYFSL
jgi:hypothetical protein